MCAPLPADQQTLSFVLFAPFVTVQSITHHFGGKDLSVVFIFENNDVMKQFVEIGWQFGGEADATAKASDKGAGVGKDRGVYTGGNLFEIYTMTDTGVALQATVAGPNIGRIRAKPIIVQANRI